VPRPNTRKRTCRYRFLSLRTMRFTLLQLPGRSVRPAGRTVLRIAASTTSRQRIREIETRLAARAHAGLPSRRGNQCRIRASKSILIMFRLHQLSTEPDPRRPELIPDHRTSDRNGKRRQFFGRLSPGVQWRGQGGEGMITLHRFRFIVFLLDSGRRPFVGWVEPSLMCVDGRPSQSCIGDSGRNDAGANQGCARACRACGDRPKHRDHPFRLRQPVPPRAGSLPKARKAKSMSRGRRLGTRHGTRRFAQFSRTVRISLSDRSKG